MNEYSKKTLLQNKKEQLILLREMDKRAEKDPEDMLESELDKEIAWRENPNRYETSDNMLKEIKDILLRVEKQSVKKKK